jgi:hypothetical protein
MRSGHMERAIEILLLLSATAGLLLLFISYARSFVVGRFYIPGTGVGPLTITRLPTGLTFRTAELSNGRLAISLGHGDYLTCRFWLMAPLVLAFVWLGRIQQRSPPPRNWQFCLMLLLLGAGLALAIPPVLALLPVVVIWREYRAGKRREFGICAQCRYLLTGNVSGVCPECGARIAEP